MSLDTNVYKTPSFTAMGMQKDREVKAERDYRESKIDATGAEDAFQSAKYEVTGVRKGVLQEAYNLYAEAAQKYEQSGSDADKKLMKQYANEVNFYAGAGMTMQGSWNKSYAEAVANEFEGYSESPEAITQRYQQRINDNAEIKVENGQILIKEGDKFVPAGQSSYFSTEINPNNSFLIQKKVETGKYILPSALLSDVKGVLTSSSSPDQAYAKAEAEFRHRLKVDPSFRQDVGTQYAISELGIIDGKQGLSREDLRKVNERMQDDEFFNSAVESYLGGLQTTIKSQFGGSSIASNPSYNETVGDVGVKMFSIDKVGDIIGVGQGVDGNYYVTKSIGSGAPPQTVAATEAEIAQIENKLGTSVRNMGTSQSQQTQEPTVQQTKEAPVSEQQTEAKEQPAQDAPDIEMPKEEEAIQKTENDPLGLGLNIQEPAAQTNREMGVAPPAPSATEVALENVPDELVMLPASYYDNLLSFEGGVATSKKDNAWAENPDAPMVNGERAHTNRGVQYRVFKEWAEEKGIPKSQWHDRFLKLAESEAVDIVNGYTKRAGADQFESPVLRSLFTQNAWGTGKVWAADFKSGRSKEYRALLDWLQSETGLDFANTSKINANEAKAIEELYNKNPEKFINTFIDKKKTHFKTLDDYDEYGKGWTNRAEDLRSKMLAELG